VKRLVFLLLACTPVTEKAGLRRAAEARVEACIKASNCTRAATLACYQEAEQWCKDHQMERTCGEGGPTGACRP